MILTGLYTNKSGIMERLGQGTPNRLPGHIPTFGDLFKDNGYKTGIAGKWHLGNFDWYPEHPVSHGFGEYLLAPGLPMNAEVNGMDLSHNFFAQPGTNREYVYLAWEGGYYMVRNKRFRIHEDGRLFDIPVTSNEARYSEQECLPKQV